MSEERRLVMFDLDGTLCQYAGSKEKHLSIAFNKLDLEPFFTVAEFENKMDTLADEASHKSELRRIACESLAVENGYDQSVGTEVGKTYSTHRRYSDVEALAGAEETLTSLSERYKLGIVTNAKKEVQQPKLESLGIDSIFDTIVYAGRDTDQKPQPEPFLTALQAVEVDPNEALYVGDDFESDILGAHAVGIDTVWVDDGQSADDENPPTFRISTMEELPPLLHSN